MSSQITNKLDYEAANKHYNRERFRDLRETNALIHCRIDYLEACWTWLYGSDEK